MAHHWTVSALALVLFACGGETAETLGSSGGGGGGGSGAGGSGGSGIGVGGCPAGEFFESDGRCTPAGMTAADCASGFAHDGVDACEPILPSEACPPGLMALPGEAQCREVAPCGDGTWGDILIASDTEHVDAHYQGGSDGSSSAPWTTIGQAFAAAAPGATIAVAEGSYVEEIDISGKAVTLWGRCPALVEIVGPSDDVATVFVHEGADGAQIRGLSLRGGALPLGVSGATDVVAEQLVIADGVVRGIEAHSVLGDTSFTLRGSLLENNNATGLLIAGIPATVEDCVIRDTQPDPADQTRGRGAVFQHYPTGMTQADVVVRRSVFARNVYEGVTVLASNVSLEQTVVIDTTAQVSDGRGGRGINITDDFPYGTGLLSDVTIRDSFTARNVDANISVFGSTLDLSTTTIRDAQPDGLVGNSGAGIIVQIDPQTDVTSQVQIRSVVIDGAIQCGIVVGGAEVEASAVVVRNVEGVFPFGGLGFHLQDYLGHPAKLTLSGAVLRDTREASLVAVGDSQVVLSGVLVRDSRERAFDGLFGDGIAVFAVADKQPQVTINYGHIETSTRVALSSFGSIVGVSNTRFECNPIDLDAEALGIFQAELLDQGGNSCGCDTDDTVCKVLSTGLTPPDPLPPEDLY